jgi:membrane protein CcdC involved in cytochrome C biogenesis
MLHLHLGIHLESLALGMALSFTIFLVIYCIRWEIQMYKKRKNMKKTLAKKIQTL